MTSPPGSHTKIAKPFLHPTVSRLRSYTPQTARLTSVTSLGTLQSNAQEGLSPAPSHFSALSPMSSTTNLRVALEKRDLPTNGHTLPEREVFRWTHLRSIGNHIFSKAPQKASTLLGSPATGSPLVLAANGLICIGTDTGRVFVFDFKQTLRCICGDPASGKHGQSSDSYRRLYISFAQRGPWVQSRRWHCRMIIRSSPLGMLSVMCSFSTSTSRKRLLDSSHRHRWLPLPRDERKGIYMALV
jgi:hypothetical protein